MTQERKSEVFFLFLVVVVLVILPWCAKVLVV